MCRALSPIAQAATASPTIGLNSQAKQMKKQGLDVISFAVGEPDFDTPDHIKRAAADAAARGETKYGPAAGLMELREAVAGKFKKDNGLDYNAKQVLISNGGKQSLFMAVFSLVGPGDEVIIPSPYWVSYPEQVRMSGGTFVDVETSEENGFVPTAEQIEAAVTPQTKLLILCSPSNPTGAVIPEDQMRAIVDVAVKHDFWIISDEIYEKLIYDGARHVSPASFSREAFDHVITANGVAKTYAMTGWRIGYIAGPEDVIKKAGMLQSHLSSGPNTMAQWAAKQAIEGDQSKVEEFRKTFDERRKLIVGLLNEIDGVSCRTPGGAFYAFPNVQGLLGRTYGGEKVVKSLQLSELLLQQKHIAVTPGSAFGAEGYLRFSYALSEEHIREGVQRLADFAAKGRS